MAVDHIRYDLLAQDALRGVVRTVLSDAAANGLPGEHHFVITFDTTADGVKLPPRLLTQYPSEMTIVLQHQFWDLTVADDRFEVGLAFKGVTERLGVPFAAIKSFVDPSVQFGLQFAIESQDDQAENDQAEDTESQRESAGASESADGSQREPSPASETAPVAADAGRGEVVRLDRFRKK